MTGVATFRDVCIDANDPERVGAFWGALLGRQPADAGQGGGATRDVVLRETADSHGPTIWVNGVQEPKRAKARVHIDVDLRADCTVDDVLALGATVVTPLGSKRWWVLADPEGTEFCAFPPEPS